MEDIYPSRHASKPNVLPRRDPVFHGHYDSSAPISRALTEKFDRDGYIVLQNLFDLDEVRLLQAEAKIIVSNPIALDPYTIVMEPGGDEVRSVFRIHDQSPLVARLIRDERLAGLARYLLGDEVYIHQSRLNCKPGFRGEEFYWHSDFETWHVEDGMPRMRALSMSILLEPNTANNGPLMVMPGSHTKYVACVGETPDDHYLTSLKKQEYGVPDDAILRDLAEANGIHAPLGEPGTVVIFDCNLMHGSNGNITPFPRSNAFIVYNAVSNKLCAPYGAKKPRPTFIASREVRPLRVITGALTEPAL